MHLSNSMMTCCIAYAIRYTTVGITTERHSQKVGDDSATSLKMRLLGYMAGRRLFAGGGYLYAGLG